MPVQPYHNSASLCKYIAAQTDTVLVSFSAGKDSVATWLQCRPYFRRMIPFYLEVVPGLGFVEKTLKYYEGFLGERILRFPHPSTLRMLASGAYQLPFGADYLMNDGEVHKTQYDYRDIEHAIRASMELPHDTTYTAIGIRAGDSLYRRLALSKNGAHYPESMVFYPIYDKTPGEMCDMLENAGVKLPPDYHLFHRSLDGISEMYLKPIKEHYPEDYKKILRYFPMAEADVMRKQYRYERTGRYE